MGAGDFPPHPSWGLIRNGVNLIRFSFGEHAWDVAGVPPRERKSHVHDTADSSARRRSSAWWTKNIGDLDSEGAFGVYRCCVRTWALPDLSSAALSSLMRLSIRHAACVFAQQYTYCRKERAPYLYRLCVSLSSFRVVVLDLRSWSWPQLGKGACTRSSLFPLHVSLVPSPGSVFS